MVYYNIVAENNIDYLRTWFLLLILLIMPSATMPTSKICSPVINNSIDVIEITGWENTVRNENPYLFRAKNKSEIDLMKPKEKKNIEIGADTLSGLKYIDKRIISNANEKKSQGTIFDLPTLLR